MTAKPGYKPYEPLQIPKPWAHSIWTVDGPEVGFSFVGLTIPCPTRMTVIKLADGSLWVHSPIEHSASLADELAQIGPVAHIIAPNMHHFVHLADWAARYRDAKVYALEALSRKIGLAQFVALDRCEALAWQNEIDPIHFDAGDFQECAFVHRGTRTAIFTDLMQIFEADRIANPLIRMILSLGGATGPHGQPSIDMRFALRKHREAMKRGLAVLDGLTPESVILAHGRCYQSNAREAIRRAFAYI